ncbi:MAG: translation elongation factor Ts [Gammaproteobacteria bacterium]
MSAVSAEMVKNLRAATGAGMMECKKALVECGGDLSQAADFLRVKSGVKADKVAGRAAGEGRLGFAQNGNIAVLAEICCETDFVARGEAFAAFCRKTAQRLAEAPAEIIAAVSSGAQTTVLQNPNPPEECEGEKARRELVMQVGENVSFGRARALPAKGAIAHYIHPGDKIAAVLDYSGGDETLAREMCMHIAALRPEYATLEDIPPDEMKKQREIFTAQAAESGKPAAIAEKIAEGRLNKYFAERVFAEQPFVKDEDKTAGETLRAAGMTAHGFCWLAAG